MSYVGKMNVYSCWVAPRNASDTTPSSSGRLENTELTEHNLVALVRRDFGAKQHDDYARTRRTLRIPAKRFLVMLPGA